VNQNNYEAIFAVCNCPNCYINTGTSYAEFSSNIKDYFNGNLVATLIKKNLREITKLNLMHLHFLAEFISTNSKQVLLMKRKK
jgi:hypothetical protein